MNIAEATEMLQGRLVEAGAEGAGREVRGGYCSDLLSDVIANAGEGDIWITLQRHVNIVAVAQLKGLAGIVIVNSREPETDTAARAEVEKIPIIRTDLTAFEVAGVLYGAGVRGRRPI